MRNLMVVVAFVLAGSARAEVAQVNGKTLTESEARAAITRMPAALARTVLRDGNSRRQFVQGWIDERLVADEGERARLDQEPAYQAALQQFRSAYFQGRLHEKNVAARATSAEMKKFYQANRRRYSTESVRVQHILVQDEATARELARKGASPDEDFQALAEKFSRDPSAKNNRGELGYLSRATPIDGAFLGAAFDGAAGEIVGPVATNYGYHVIKVIDRQPGKTLGYDEVETQVRADLIQSLQAEYLAKLRRGAKVSINQQALGKL